MALTLFFLLGSTLLSPPHADTIPGPLSGHRMVYDPEQNRMLVYSGVRAEGDSSRRYRSVLWSLSEGRWQRLTEGGPPGRDDAQLVYDSGRGKLILHGGRQFGTERGLTILNDTWEWDGEAWTERAPPAPPPRMHPGMTYDPKRAVTVLFGGFGRDDSLLQDTWEWDGATWRHVTSEGPIGRWVNGLVYDSHLQAVVLHGASRASYDRAAGTAAGELWRWDGHHWNPIGDTPPISPQQPPVAMREGILYFFGWRNGAPPTTWFWNRRAWHQVEGPAPEPRRGAALAYDELRHVVLLHGGENDQRAFADLWEFDGRSWARKDSRPSR